MRLKIIGVDSVPGVDRLPDNVDITGRVPINTLRENIARARFVVLPLPYYKYSYGQMSFLQSMAQGKSCIVTKTPSTHDYLTHNEDALLVRAFDKEDLAEKIMMLLHNDALNNIIAKNARETIENKYNEERNGRRTL